MVIGMEQAETLPRNFLSMARKLSAMSNALLKAETTIRNQELELDRLKRQLAQVRSNGWTLAHLPLR